MYLHQKDINKIIITVCNSIQINELLRLKIFKPHN